MTGILGIYVISWDKIQGLNGITTSLLPYFHSPLLVFVFSPGL